jgi:hypothetical protein
MTTADSYRTMAAELKARAANEASSRMAPEWEHLARCYIRLAEQAEQNGKLDIAVEFGTAQTAKTGPAKS